ncbi:MAG: hypothetical protein R3320_07470 [Nitriliruptorales bacterium]|nr:hypothetical protein [Nitriliruptorales bacterium]
MTQTGIERVYGLIVDDDEEPGPAAVGVSDQIVDEVPGNAVKLVGALTLQKVGDRIVDPKTVLAWLFGALAVPTVLTGLLVPIRESGSLLPQAALIPLVRRVPRRKWVWVAGATGMAVAVLGMAAVTATTDGTTAGILVLVALAVFALSRSLGSIASKDVRGRTIPKGKRGQITGAAAITSGIVAITFGVAIQIWGGQDADPATFAILLVVAAAPWIAALSIFATIVEPIGEHDEEVDVGATREALSLLIDDPPFRRFVTARALLLVSALTPPFVVALATAEGGEVSLSGLGPFVIAQGLASLLGGRLWGRWADRSSRRVMMTAAGLASAVVIVFLVLISFESLRTVDLLYPLTYFALALIHTGSRIGRKTYVVDLAEGNRRTDYVAVANTAMGVLLLVAGAISAGLSALGAEVALGFLALLGVLAVPVGQGLPEVSVGG